MGLDRMRAGTVEETDFVPGRWIPGAWHGTYLPLSDTCIQSDGT